MYNINLSQGEQSETIFQNLMFVPYTFLFICLFNTKPVTVCLIS